MLKVIGQQLPKSSYSSLTTSLYAAKYYIELAKRDAIEIDYDDFSYDDRQILSRIEDLISELIEHANSATRNLDNRIDRGSLGEL